MRSLFLSPHNDDETLFAAYTLLAYKPVVVTVLEPHLQEKYGISGEQRMFETTRALRWLEIEEHIQWSGVGLRDDDADFRMIGMKLGFLLKEGKFDRVFAPQVKHGGHEQHTLVGEIASRLVPADKLVFYCTYKRGHARTRSETEVKPKSEWPGLKLGAMACYQSQVNLDNTRPWFSDWDREWVA